MGTPLSSPAAAPLRGNVGCVDLQAMALRDTTIDPVLEDQDAVNIFGPMENGFASGQPGASCLGDNVVSGGIDTNTAEHVMNYLCSDSDETIQILDTCGGHAVPYHYHERMSCLYASDEETGHSTRIGTAGDGNGIYGMYVEGGSEPDDLDYCGGRHGVTPDSNGEVVYYYPITSAPPFSLGCYGPVTTMEECKALYPSTCGDDAATVEEVTTEYGSGLYTLDCPCYDENGSNVVGQGRPGFLAPVTTPNTPVPTPEPTPSPTPEPTPTPPTDPVVDDCTDTDWVYINRRGREQDCSWVAQSTRRCDRIDGVLPGSTDPVLARDGCPGTCNTECQD